MTEPNEFQPLLDWMDKWCEEAVKTGTLRVMPGDETTRQILEEMNAYTSSDSGTSST